MVLTIDLNLEFYSLFIVSVLAALLTGSTLQWVASDGYCHNQYNVIVTIASMSSLIQTVTCFINALMAPNHNISFMIYILINWVIMTHSSTMLVSRKLSLTFQNPEQAWKRLLLINLFMLPISILTCVYWTIAHNFDNDVFDQINKIMEPVQIALWGIIEFCLSGAFIIQMWKFKWTPVEKRGILILVLVGICDTMTVLLNVFLGDLPSTSVKGFVYCLRIRLEVDILCKMVSFVSSKRGSITYGGPSTRRVQNALHDSWQRTNVGDAMTAGATHRTSTPDPELCITGGVGARKETCPLPQGDGDNAVVVVGRGQEDDSKLLSDAGDEEQQCCKRISTTTTATTTQDGDSQRY